MGPEVADVLLYLCIVIQLRNGPFFRWWGSGGARPPLTQQGRGDFMRSEVSKKKCWKNAEKCATFDFSVSLSLKKNLPSQYQRGR